MTKLMEKQKYKQTEIGEIPEDWEVKTFGDVIAYIKGFPFKSMDYKADGVRIIRVSDTTYDSIKNENPIYIDRERAHEFYHWKLEEDDLILSTVGSKPPMYASMVGKVVLIKKKYVGSLLNQNLVLIRAKKKSKMIQNLLLSHFKTKRYLYHIEEIFRGNANQASITLEELFKYKIPLPAHGEEQTAIATVLSDTDELITSIDKLIAKKKAIKQGTMQELLAGKKRLPGFERQKGFKQTELGEIPEDWEILKLDEVSKTIDSLHQTPNFANDGFAMVRVVDIKPGLLNLQNTLKVEKKVFQEYTKNYQPKQGDIVLSRVGSYGVSSFVNTNEPFCIGQNTVVIIPKIENKYLYYVLNSVTTLQQIDDGSYGSGYKSLSLKNIKELKLKFTSLLEQTAIATVLSDMDSELESLEKKRDKYLMIKQGMMQQLLTGKIRLI